MKKIIILLLATGLFTATYAQGRKNYSKGNNRYSPNNYHRQYNPHYRGEDHRTHIFQKQSQMARINQEFRYRVLAIQQNRYMTNRQKRLSIRDAKNERNYKIQMLNHYSNGYADSNYGRNHRK